MKKQLISAKAKTAKTYPSFELVVKYCKLFPVDSWNKWSDGAGNILKINKEGEIFIHNSKNQKPIQNDLFAKADCNNTEHHWKWASTDGEYLWTLGLDERLRVCYDGKIIAPLSLGFSRVYGIIQQLF